MRVISKAAIREFSTKYPDALEPLLHWYRVVKEAAWANLAETRQDFGSADPVDILTVFNIDGNKCGLIVIVKYRWQIIYIRRILTHSAYSKGKWKL